MLLGVGGVANIVFSVAILQWKKWACGACSSPQVWCSLSTIGPMGQLPWSG